jgi:hypothetical protein
MIEDTKKNKWIVLAIFAFLVACSSSDTTGPGPDDGSVRGGDRVPPQGIVDLGLAYPTVGGSAVLTWTAPRDDDERDTVARYEIRYAYSAPFDWEISLLAPDPPDPVKEGENQRYELAEPLRGCDLYAAIRSYDADGNVSPISGVASVHVDGYNLEGWCKDAVSGEPLEGLDVEIIDRHVHLLNTDAQGRYRLTDLTTGVVNVTLRSGATGKNYHNYSYTFEPSGDTSLEHPMIEYVPTENPVGRNILELFLRGAGGLTNRDPLLKKWQSYPVAVYVPPLVNAHGLDYEDFCKRAAEYWNDKTGLDVFVLVDMPPDVGVTMAFKTPAEMGIQNGITHHGNDAEGFPWKSDIDLVDTFADPDKLWSVALHELGHAIRIRHLPEGYLMYAGQPLPTTITNDEVKVVQLYLILPNEYDVTVYDPSKP